MVIYTNNIYGIGLIRTRICFSLHRVRYHLNLYTVTDEHRGLCNSEKYGFKDMVNEAFFG